MSKSVILFTLCAHANAMALDFKMRSNFKNTLKTIVPESLKLALAALLSQFMLSNLVNFYARKRLTNSAYCSDLTVSWQKNSSKAWIRKFQNLKKKCSNLILKKKSWCKPKKKIRKHQRNKSKNKLSTSRTKKLTLKF